MAAGEEGLVPQASRGDVKLRTKRHLLVHSSHLLGIGNPLGLPSSTGYQTDCVFCRLPPIYLSTQKIHFLWSPLTVKQVLGSLGIDFALWSSWCTEVQGGQRRSETSALTRLKKQEIWQVLQHSAVAGQSSPQSFGCLAPQQFLSGLPGWICSMFIVKSHCVSEIASPHPMCSTSCMFNQLARLQSSNYRDSSWSLRMAPSKKCNAPYFVYQHRLDSFI